MKKEKILELLNNFLLPEVEYEFWYNHKTSEFGGMKFEEKDIDAFDKLMNLAKRPIMKFKTKEEYMKWIEEE